MSLTQEAQRKVDVIKAGNVLVAVEEIAEEGALVAAWYATFIAGSHRLSEGEKTNFVNALTHAVEENE